MKALALAVLVFVGCSSSNKVEDPQVAEEVKRRETFAKNLLNDASVGDAHIEARQVAASADVKYLDGFSPVVFDPPDDWWSHAFRWVSQKGHLRLRTKGNQPMYLRIAGWMHVNGIDVRPELRLDIWGQSVPLKPPTKPLTDKHLYEVEAEIDPALFQGQEWIDLYMIFSAVAWHWYEWPDLRVLTVTELKWCELSKKESKDY